MTDPTTPRVAILPYGVPLGWRPSALALDRLIWPLGQPEGIAGQTLGDLRPEDHLIVPPRDTHHCRLGFGTRAHVSLMFMEPRAIHSHHMQLLRLTHRRFYRVLSADDTLLAQIPNGVFFPFGDSWVQGWRDLEIEKTAMCSLIASAKRSQEGHRLRHDTVEWIRAGGRDVDVMGMGYRPFAAKSEGLAPYRFSIVIENVRERNYFSEKLVDAILCQCVPIYWGCPNIGDFFDPAAIIQCESAADVRRAVEQMNEAGFKARQPALAAMRARAGEFADLHRRAAEAVLAEG